jgi:hypothetical protein
MRAHFDFRKCRIGGNLKKYQVTVPSEYIGHAIGHLSGIGGFIDGIAPGNTERRVLSVRLPAHLDPVEVKDVLAKIVRGEVTVVGGEAANDEDA